MTAAASCSRLSKASTAVSCMPTATSTPSNNTWVRVDRRRQRCNGRLISKGLNAVMTERCMHCFVFCLLGMDVTLRSSEARRSTWSLLPDPYKRISDLARLSHPSFQLRLGICNLIRTCCMVDGVAFGCRFPLSATCEVCLSDRECQTRCTVRSKPMSVPRDIIWWGSVR